MIACSMAADNIKRNLFHFVEFCCFLHIHDNETTLQEMNSRVTSFIVMQIINILGLTIYICEHNVPTFDDSQISFRKTWE